jgi:hypothetical protein
MAKIQEFRQKFRFETKAGTWYRNHVGGIIVKMADGFQDQLHILIRPMLEFKRKFGLISAPKRDFLSSGSVKKCIRECLW